MKTVTIEEWDNKHSDYKGSIDGWPYMLDYEENVGTVYAPVRLVGNHSPYITRYIAHDHPDTWIVNPDPQMSGGAEWASYRLCMDNEGYEGQQDGIAVDIVSYQGNGWLLEAEATRPDKGRRMYTRVKRYNTYEEAEAAALAFIKRAKEFCRWRLGDSCLQWTGNSPWRLRRRNSGYTMWLFETGREQPMPERNY
jgi:hypothetical protein